MKHRLGSALHSAAAAELTSRRKHLRQKMRRRDRGALSLTRLPRVEKLRARGGKIVFVRFPMTGDLKSARR